VGTDDTKSIRLWLAPSAGGAKGWYALTIKRILQYIQQLPMKWPCSITGQILFVTFRHLLKS